MTVQILLVWLLTATKAQMPFGVTGNVTGNVLWGDTLTCHNIGHRCHTIGQDLLKKLLKQIDKVSTQNKCPPL